MDAEKLAQFKEDLTKMGFFEWTAWCVCWEQRRECFERMSCR